MSRSAGSSRAYLVAVAAAVGLVGLWAIRSVLVMTLFAVLLAYALDPLVTALERVRLPRGRTVPRGAAAAVVMLALLVVLGSLIGYAAPRLTSEIAGFARALPDNVERLSAALREWAGVRGLASYVDPMIDGVRALAIDNAPQLGAMLLRWLGGLFGNLVQVLGLAALPLLSFYLLAEREAVQASLYRFVPEETRPTLERVSGAVDRALKSYVRGQAMVCLVMGATTGVVLGVLGLPAPLLLGAVVAIAEVVPFLGFAVAATAIALAGFGVSPVQALVGVVAYVVVNYLIGTWITPRVMGRHLTMHPFVVTVSILAGAELLGPAGALLALPGAAVVQSLIQEFAARPVARAAAG